jgi:TIGR03009 family protein
MRKLAILLGPMLLTGPASAQVDAKREAAPMPVVVDPVVDAHLTAWQKRWKEIDNLTVAFELTREETLLRSKKTYSGNMVVMKPNMLRMRLENPNDPADYHAYLYDGKTTFINDGGRKAVTSLTLPPFRNPPDKEDKLQQWLNRWFSRVNITEAFSAMAVPSDVRRTYRIKLIKPEKPDKNYLYFELEPMRPHHPLFDKAMIAVYSPTVAEEFRSWVYLPAKVVLTKNNNESFETWTITQYRLNRADLTKDDFQYVDPGPDWQKPKK